MQQLKRKTVKNAKTTVLPGMLSVMRSFSLCEEGYNEETTWGVLVWEYISARTICCSTPGDKAITTPYGQKPNKPFRNINRCLKGSLGKIWRCGFWNEQPFGERNLYICFPARWKVCNWNSFKGRVKAQKKTTQKVNS